MKHNAIKQTEESIGHWHYASKELQKPLETAKAEMETL